MLRSFYAAKIDATRRSLPRNQVVDAIRAILDEQQAAFRELAFRQACATAARRESRATLRHAEIVALRNARAPPPETLPT